MKVCLSLDFALHVFLKYTPQDSFFAISIILLQLLISLFTHPEASVDVLEKRWLEFLKATIR